MPRWRLNTSSVSSAADGAVATTTLMHERSHGDPSAAKPTDAGGREGRVYDEEREEIAIATEPYGWYPQRAAVWTSSSNAHARPEGSTIQWSARRSPSC